MSKFIADASFWELFPDAKLGVVLLKDIRLEKDSPREIKKLLRESNENAWNYLTEGVFSENRVIKIYREAFQKFKTKKKARCSIEALLKRVEKNNPVSTINPLVDIYNAASLKFGLPCGAEDIDTFVGDLRLTVTEGNDEFQMIGEDRNSPTLAGELCYKDDKGAVCRCFNWRDGERTMITEKTKNAFIVMELLDIEREESLKEAMDLIEEYSIEFLGAEVERKIITKEDTGINLL